MSGASTLTKSERFAIAMDDVRREFDIVSADCKYFIERAKELEAENAKLRELVCMMNRRDVLLPCMTSCNTKCRYYDDDICKRIASLMRELGIEVGE